MHQKEKDRSKNRLCKRALKQEHYAVIRDFFHYDENPSEVFVSNRHAPLPDFVNYSLFARN